MQKSEKNTSWVKKYDVALEYQTNKERIGRGTYGTVFKAKNLIDDKYYAIKKLQNNDQKLQMEGFPITALRQITLLKQMNHPNVIKLKEIILSKPSQRNKMRGSTFLVFQYMHHDLAGIHRKKQKFTLPQIKCIAKQLLEGLAYLHSNNILHRDIKAANILLNNKGQIKLADFGLGRKFIPNNNCYYTSKVVTLWYRAPQLLVGLKKYNTKVDVWSLGCVIVELFTSEVLFKKDTQFSQLQKILEICGDFYANQVPRQLINDCFSFRDMQADKKKSERKLKTHLKNLNPSMDQYSLDFLDKLLQINPNSRMSCEQALKHQFFRQTPLACQKNKIRKFDHQIHQLSKQDPAKILNEEEQKKSQKGPKVQFVKNSHKFNDYNKKDYYNFKDKDQNYKKYSPKKIRRRSRSQSDRSYNRKSRERSRQKKRRIQKYYQKRSRSRSRQKKDDYYRYQNEYYKRRSHQKHSQDRSYQKQHHYKTSFNYRRNDSYQQNRQGKDFYREKQYLKEKRFRQKSRSRQKDDYQAKNYQRDEKKNYKDYSGYNNNNYYRQNNRERDHKSTSYFNQNKSRFSKNQNYREGQRQNIYWRDRQKRQQNDQRQKKEKGKQVQDY